MDIQFIAQPYDNVQLGPLLINAISYSTPPKAVTIVSAFASLATVIRIKQPLLVLKNTKVRLVVGVDMGGTSKEVLKELASWSFAEVVIFKNRKSGVTFHPKIYFIEREHTAEIYVGSNNLTDGGLFSNYEGAAHVSYDFPKDRKAFDKARNELSKFIEPTGPVAKRLDSEYLEKLISRDDIPSDIEVRKRRKEAKVGTNNKKMADDTFGFESTPGAAALPVEYQEVVIAANTLQMQEIVKSRRKSKHTTKEKTTQLGRDWLLKSEPIAQIATPTAFYMELNATKGANGNIPGEQRIPLEAIWSAQEFWGWPENYVKSVNPRKGKVVASSTTQGEISEDRVYHNWYPKWRISVIGDSEKKIIKEVRMYFYENSSDFRFTSGDIAKWGEPGDIVKIVRQDDGTVDYDCLLAKKGSKEHKEWESFCKQRGRSDRKFGFS